MSSLISTLIVTALKYVRLNSSPFVHTRPPLSYWTDVLTSPPVLPAILKWR